MARNRGGRNRGINPPGPQGGRGRGPLFRRGRLGGGRRPFASPRRGGGGGFGIGWILVGIVILVILFAMCGNGHLGG